MRTYFRREDCVFLQMTRSASSHLQENAVLERYRSSRCVSAVGCAALAPLELFAMLPRAGALQGVAAHDAAPVLQVTCSFWNGSRSAKVEPFRLKVGRHRVDRVRLNHNPECIRLNLKVSEPRPSL